MEHQIIQPIKAEFELQTSWFLNSLADISNDEACRQLRPNLNPILWVAGHIVNTRMVLVSILTGSKHDHSFNIFFGKGSSNKIDISFPSIDEIIKEWNAVSTTLIMTFSNIPNAKLLDKPPFQTSIPDNSLLGLIAYMAIHETYHIGQLSVLRKLLDKPAMEMRKN